MPGKTWKDLKRPEAGAATVGTAAPREDALSLAKQQSPRLASLLEQRESLEGRMSALSGAGDPSVDPRDAIRFQVPSFAERREQQRSWERQREAQRQRTGQTRRPVAKAPSAQPERPGRATERFRAAPEGGAPRSALSSLSQWLDRRDAERRSLRDSIGSRLEPVAKAGQDIGRQVKDSLSDTRSQLRDLDKRLAEEGLDEEREELRSLGTDKLDKASSTIDKYAKKAEGPMRAVKKVDDAWTSRRDKISGEMDRVGPYVDMMKRRLSCDTGGSGDLFERMQNNRMRALKKRRELRRQEQRDDARRERARKKSRD